MGGPKFSGSFGYAQDDGVWVGERNARQSEGRSRFPEGMTERKANAEISPLRITETRA